MQAFSFSALVLLALVPLACSFTLSPSAPQLARSTPQLLSSQSRVSHRTAALSLRAAVNAPEKQKTAPVSEPVATVPAGTADSPEAVATFAALGMVPFSLILVKYAGFGAFLTSWAFCVALAGGLGFAASRNQQ